MATARTWLVSASMVLGIAGAIDRAGAQVLLPPTSAPPKTPDYVPPPPAPVVPRTAPNAATPPRPKAPEPLPNFDFKSLVERDQAGNILPLKLPVHRAALERNPLIDEETKKKIAAAVSERDGQLERLAIDNLDVVLKVDDNGFAKIEADDAKAEIRALKALGDPIKPVGGELTTVLSKSGVLNDVQTRSTQKIILDYTKTVFSELRTRKDAEKAASGEKPGDTHRPTGISSARMVYMIQVEETMGAYHHLLQDASKSVDTLVKGLALPDDKRTASSEVVAGVRAAKDDEGKLNAMRAFMQKIGAEPGREFLKKAVAARGK